MLDLQAMLALLVQQARQVNLAQMAHPGIVEKVETRGMLVHQDELDLQAKEVKLAVPVSVDQLAHKAIRVSKETKVKLVKADQQDSKVLEDLRDLRDPEDHLVRQESKEIGATKAIEGKLDLPVQQDQVGLQVHLGQMVNLVLKGRLAPKVRLDLVDLVVKMVILDQQDLKALRAQQAQLVIAEKLVRYYYSHDNFANNIFCRIIWPIWCSRIKG